MVNEISNIGHAYRDTTEVFGVSPNFFEIAIPGFLHIHEVAKDKGNLYFTPICLFIIFNVFSISRH